MRTFKISVSIAFLILWGSSLAWAQSDTPSTQQMIEQLKAAPSAPKTRGLRNLSVETSTESAVVQRPSLSLMIQFDFDSAKIRPESQQALMNLSSALKAQELSGANFAVEGHTDAKGIADYNVKLSKLRADAVQHFLVQQGVSPSRLVASGKGSSQLANTADPLAAENRRVRIVNLE